MSSLAELLTGRARELSRHLEGAVRGDADDVHKGRVASRRLREALPAAGRGGGQAARRARKTFRAITRALGPVRELDVALGHLEDGLSGSRIPRTAIERVRAHVLAERERRRERMLARLERVDLDDAAARVARVARGAEAVTPYSAARLARRIARRAGALASALERAGTVYHPGRLHQVRIAAKKLRYALEVAEATGLPGAKPRIRTLKRAQETLGVMHDYQVLLEHVADVRDATPKGTTGASGLEAMATAYNRECRRLHAEYLKMAPQLVKTAHALQRLEVEAGDTGGRG